MFLQILEIKILLSYNQTSWLYDFLFGNDNMKIAICDDNLNIVDEVKDLLDEYALSKNLSLDISTFNNGQGYS